MPTKTIPLLCLLAGVLLTSIARGEKLPYAKTKIARRTIDSAFSEPRKPARQ